LRGDIILLDAVRGSVSYETQFEIQYFRIIELTIYKNVIFEMRIVRVVLFTIEGPLFVNLEHPLLPDH